MTVTEIVLACALFVAIFVAAPAAYWVGRLERDDETHNAYWRGFADGSVRAGKLAAEKWGRG